MAMVSSTAMVAGKVSTCPPEFTPFFFRIINLFFILFYWFCWMPNCLLTHRTSAWWKRVAVWPGLL